MKLKPLAETCDFQRKESFRELDKIWAQIRQSEFDIWCQLQQQNTDILSINNKK